MTATGLIGPLLGLVGALVLVGAALRRRRLGGRRLLILATAWAGIILLVWAVATLGLQISRASFT